MIYGVRSRFPIAHLPCWAQEGAWERQEEARERKGTSVADRPAVDPSRGVYGISVAAELAGMGVQTLRLFEARGLLQPDRTDGGTRRYSPDDLDRIHRIGQLLDAGLNLAGISMVLDLEAQNQQLRADRHDGD
jgi:MerR family transcriptional regulator, heat shock protein HspR